MDTSQRATEPDPALLGRMQALHPDLDAGTARELALIETDHPGFIVCPHVNWPVTRQFIARISGSSMELLHAGSVEAIRQAVERYGH